MAPSSVGGLPIVLTSNGPSCWSAAADRAGFPDSPDTLLWPMAELTDDVREMKQFLTDTCAGVKRWLPEPEWRPGRQSDAPRDAWPPK